MADDADAIARRVPPNGMRAPEDAYLMQFCCQPEEADLILPMNRIERLAG